MKALLFNTYESLGGAAIATKRIHKALQKVGLESSLCVLIKDSSDDSVVGKKNSKFVRVLSKYRCDLDAIETWVYRNRTQDIFSPARITVDIRKQVTLAAADIVHLFWLQNGFIGIESIEELDCPVVWTLHDMWPFTGGCHYDEECGRYRDNCGFCPKLKSDKEKDLSNRILQRKKKAWRNSNITIVAISTWLAKCARESALFGDARIEIIPNAIDVDLYKPHDQKAARDALNLPQNKKIILFSSFKAISDKRKGFQLLIPAMQKLADRGLREELQLAVVGASDSAESIPGVEIKYFGVLEDADSQILLYSAADLLVLPSMQENLSNTVMESLSCGTPVVAYDVGGTRDMVSHKINGYLAKPFDINDLADGIAWVLEHNKNNTVSESARQSVCERFSDTLIAKRYLSLYTDLLK